MPKNITTTSKNEKAKAADRPPSRCAPNPNPTTIPPLHQLKQAIKTTPGIIKNAEDALHHLSTKQWLVPHQDVTCTQLAAILLSLVATNGQCSTSDKILENVANIIKAVAFLLEEAVVTKYAKTIAGRLAGNSTLHTATQTNVETSNSIKESLETLNKTLQEQVDHLRVASENIHKIHDSLSSINTNTITNVTYRDTLVNGTLSTHTTQPLPANSIKAKLQNRVNIEACQILVKIQRNNDPSTNDPALPDIDSAGRIKSALNNRLSNKDGENPPPPSSAVRAITLYHNNKLLIESNNCETAIWLKENAEKVLHPTIRHPIKVLARTYTVIAHFTPITFQANDETIHELELSANLLVELISDITWIRDPTHRKPGQQFANVKIHCKSAEAANSLILGSGRINHLGSQLRLHKDTKDHNACVCCQKYGHIATGCKEEGFTCGKCRGDHKTWDCTSNGLKCTPCGATDHKTNDARCPKRIERANIYRDRMPEAFTPYYLTSEQWTWGLANDEPQSQAQVSTHSQSDQRSYATLPRPRRIFKGHDKQQRTLTNSSFYRNPTQTGANNIPLGHPAVQSNNLPPSPPHQHASGSGQQVNNNNQSAGTPQPPSSQQ